MDRYTIPFNKPGFVGKELQYLQDSVERGHISGDGYFSKICHKYMQEEFGLAAAFLTTSGTHALEMAALLLRLDAKDEVIIPSFSFVSTANAFVLHQAKPVFIDIRPDTLNLDESQLEDLITERTKAVVPVHYAGVGCEMDTILAIAGKYGIAVVEDNSHGLFGTYKNQPLGTLGCLSTLSFHETKNIICGEGGALWINDPQYIARAEVLREKGTDRSRLFRGEIDKYTWVDIGSSYLPSDLLAAFLWAQLEKSDRIQQKRKQIWEYYYSHLHDWAVHHGARLPFVPKNCEQPHHMFYLIMPTYKDREALMSHLKGMGICAIFHYLPLHLSEMGKRYSTKDTACPVTVDISERLIRLPFYTTLNSKEQDRVIEAIHTFYG